MNPYRAYSAADSNVNGDSKPKLLLKVYQSMLDKIDIVKSAIERRDFESKYDGLTKLTTVLEILDSSLDMTQGGDVSKNLSDLYQYLVRRLVSVHISQDVKILDECRSIIVLLNEGFVAAYEKEAKEKGPASGDSEPGNAPFSCRMV